MDSRFILPAIIFLFFIGIGGIILNRRNLLLMLISVELILLAVNIQLSLFALILDDLIGVIIALLVLTVAAAESAIGLALLVVHYRIRGSISTDLLRLLKN
uniref:NADH dehydrogenase subunit 4L n=1 Tax=Pycnococcus provasolii TaxID=41880 RepID=D3W6X2_9CHLO|nr:NADH dehydrogenase subunit 4L [Pycnococcus provasolii]ACV72091.1 NADH dehydrogenase subunit 4L [Pycnococcus provasolii]